MIEKLYSNSESVNWMSIFFHEHENRKRDADRIMIYIRHVRMLVIIDGFEILYGFFIYSGFSTEYVQPFR